MAGMLIVLVVALFCIGAGIWRITAPIDTLWKLHERGLLARGLTPRRNEVWEGQARVGGWIGLGIGIAFLALVVSALPYILPKPPKMSGAIINGYQLTQEEWDACGHDVIRCTDYVSVQHPPNYSQRQTNGTEKSRQ